MELVDEGVRLQSELKKPVKVDGSEREEAFYPSWQVIGTAYVHGIMKGEVKDKYRSTSWYTTGELFFKGNEILK